MGRIRSVKPEVCKHEALFDLEKETGLPIRFAWVGLWTVCDREGRFHWRPRSLKAEILPFDEVNFNDLLSHLERAGFIASYEVGGKKYGYIPTWHHHQTVNHKEQASRIPEPPRVSHACPTREPRVPDNSQGEGKGREGKGREGKGKDASVTVDELDDQPSTAESESSPNFETTPAGLAQAWCFYTTRRFNGRPRDDERDMAGEFDNLIKLGFDPGVLRNEILLDAPHRDRGEQFWEFKKRITEQKKKAAGPLAALKRALNAKK